MKILALDPGLTLGWAVLGGGSTRAGSRRLEGGPRAMGDLMLHANLTIRELVEQERPDTIAFAAPFVGMKWNKEKKRWQPIDPDSIRPLFGILAKAEEIGRLQAIRCVELDEQECRRAFLEHVPRGSAAQKLAVQRGCRQRGWMFSDDHAADALCIAARAFEILAPNLAHETTPLFAGVALCPKPRKSPRNGKKTKRGAKRISATTGKKIARRRSPGRSAAASRGTRSSGKRRG